MLFLDYTPELNQTEQDIYNYVSQNLEKVSYMTIRDLADATYLSKTSVWRFCKKFECDGFSDFKFKLKIYLKEREKKSIYQDVDETILINFLQRSSGELIEDRIQKAVNLLKDKEFVVFLGEGTSKVIAEYGAIYFSSLFNLSFSVSHALLHPISHMSKETVKKLCIIALFVSGSNERVLRNLYYFLEKGASIITITNTDKNAMCRIADVNIPYFISTEKNNTANITSQVPALFLIEKLAKSVANQNKN